MTSAGYCEGAIRRYSWGVFLVTKLAAKSRQDDLRAILAFYLAATNLARSSSQKSLVHKNLDRHLRIIKARPRVKPAGLWPDLFKTVDEYRIPPGYLQQFIAELVAQLDFRQPADYRQLYQSCYRMGGLIARMIAQVLGAGNNRVLKAAEHLGVAYCLTRILNHLTADLAEGKVWVPVSLMKEAGLTPKELADRPLGPRANLVLSRIAAQAEAYYLAAEQELDGVTAANRRVAKIAIDSGQAVLARIEKNGFASSLPVRLPLYCQLMILVRALATRPN
jgi:phytoene/squalene synthetase